MSKTVKIGILGLCPVCEGEFKVRDGKLVHHGFTRPGDGMIHGDCFAVGYEPYERSPKGCEDYKAAVENRLAGLKDFLADIPNRTHWTNAERNWRGQVVLVDYAIGVTDAYVWERFVTRKVYETESSIRSYETEIARMDRLIAAWALKDLREVTEEAAKALVKAERDARAAEKAAKKAEKDKKAAELKAKRDAREAKREAAFQAFVGTLTALDASDKSRAEKVTEAREAWYTFFSKKTKRELGDLMDFYYAFRKRNLEDLLVRLGAATSEGGYVSYLYNINF